MEIKIKSKFMQISLAAFLAFGGAAYGCMFISYMLWWAGVVQ